MNISNTSGKTIFRTPTELPPQQRKQTKHL